MALKDALAAELTTTKGPDCLTCRLLRDLPKDESAVLTDALNDPRFSTAGINRALKAEGHNVNVSRHRQGECKGAAKP